VDVEWWILESLVGLVSIPISIAIAISSVEATLRPLHPSQPFVIFVSFCKSPSSQRRTKNEERRTSRAKPGFLSVPTKNEEPRTKNSRAQLGADNRALVDLNRCQWSDSGTVVVVVIVVVSGFQ